MASLFTRLRKPASPDTVELPDPSASTAPPVEIDPPSVSGSAPVFASDQSPVADALGIAPKLRNLTELITHGATQTPLSIGIFGAAGSGKSFAVTQLLDNIDSLSAAAAKLSATPFVKKIATARVDAAVNSDPAIAIASAIYESLNASRNGQSSFADWAEAAVYRSGDPQQIVREESERVTNLRRRQDSENQTLEDIQGRRARLTENVLYDAAGTRIDGYARKNRGSIESRLTSFGFASPDPIATYKDLVRDYSENGGIMRRIGMFFHSLWAFNGQMKLIVLAILFVGLGWLMGQFATQPVWLTHFMTSLQERFSGFASLAAWIKNNAAQFTLIKNAAFIAGAGALLLNVVRAMRFLGPIKRGANLLNADIDTRRRDLDNLIQGQNQRVKDIGTEVEAQSKRLEEAQLRADAARSAPSTVSRSPFSQNSDDTRSRAQNFLNAMTHGLANGKDAGAPERIVVALDNLDALPPRQAAAFVQQVKPILNGPGMACLVAIDPAHLKAGLQSANTDTQEPKSSAGEAALDNSIARLVQIPFHVERKDDGGFGSLVKSLLGDSPATTQPAMDAAKSVLDDPMRPGETELLSALSDLAGTTPRQVKRYVNIYRLIRSETPVFAPLALSLAVQSGAQDQEKRDFENLLQGLGDEDALPVSQDAGSRISAAIKSASTAQVGPLTAGAIREAQAIAAPYSGKF